jgi:hypothetical protein
MLLSGCQASTHRPVGEPLAISDFPEPPRQTATWEPNTNAVSPEFASATATLFDQGLADPRGCDYREIEIHVGEVWRGDGGTIKTHGWVLPGAANTNMPFAVCWNGLVYPVVSAGGPVDLQTDVESLAASAVTHAPRMGMALYGRAFSEKLSVAPDSHLPLKACLLLRLDRGDWAAKVWDACNVSRENSPGQDQPKDPYLMLAGNWAWSFFDRTICAHMRGDVPLALVSARKLAALQPKMEAEAARRGFPLSPARAPGREPAKAQLYLPFLESLSPLLPDLERRAHEPKQKSVVEMGLTNFPNQSDRIAALVEDLDLVKARQMGQPGRVIPQTDPIVEALVKEGGSAVEPLLKCWENDRRLTCSVGFGRDFFRDRRVLPVASAARAAVEEILQTQFQSAMEARAYWEQFRGLSQEERWYQVLRQETIAQEQPVRVMPAGGTPRTEKTTVLGRGPWMDAARMIVQSNNITGVPSIGFHSMESLPPGEAVKLRGEPLRGKRDPSVTELLVKNAGLAADQADHLDQFQGVDAIRVGTELTGIINIWEKPAALVPARRLMRRAIALWSEQNTFIGSSGHYLARDIPRLTEFQVEAGDAGSLEDYVAWIKTADVEKVEEYAVDAFEPLWRNRTNPAIAVVSEWLFNDPASPWSKLPWKRATFRGPVDSDLVKLPAFHKLLARELDNRDAIGSMEYFQSNTIRYEFKDSGGGTRGIVWPTGEEPAVGTRTDLRQCDWIAFSLSNAKQIPVFNPFAPTEKRDAAIQTAKTVLLSSK